MINLKTLEDSTIEFKAGYHDGFSAQKIASKNVDYKIGHLTGTKDRATEFAIGACLYGGLSIENKDED